MPFHSPSLLPPSSSPLSLDHPFKWGHWLMHGGKCASICRGNIRTPGSHPVQDVLLPTLCEIRTPVASVSGMLMDFLCYIKEQDSVQKNQKEKLSSMQHCKKESFFSPPPATLLDLH